MIGILKAASDAQITTEEVSNAMWGVFNSAVYGIVLMFSVKMFIESTNPPKKEAREMLRIAEMT